MFLASSTRALVLRLAIFPPLGMLIGCGGESTAGARGASGDATHFVDQVSATICETAAQCCPPNGHAAPIDCVATAEKQLHADLDSEIAAGIGVNVDAADKCLAAYRGLAPSCPAVWDRTPFGPCKQALAGTSPPGGSCDPGCAPSNEGEVVCASSTSVASDGGTVTSPRTCEVLITSPPEGPCDSDRQKPIVHTCDTSAGSWCAGGRCSVPVATGGVCTGSDCASGAYCRNGTCQPKLAIGATCSGSNGDCVSGASCDQGTLTCRAADLWKKLCEGDFN